ncbi:MAG: hypothetical protein AB7F35_21350 [Acetobacteraceae bacterium]
MRKPHATRALALRADKHAALLEAAATLLELDGIGLDPDDGHVVHLRRMAGSIRARAALGELAQSYDGGRLVSMPRPLPSPRARMQEAELCN